MEQLKLPPERIYNLLDLDENVINFGRTRSSRVDVVFIFLPA
jgi:hypothetical protein